MAKPSILSIGVAEPGLVIRNPPDDYQVTADTADQRPLAGATLAESDETGREFKADSQDPYLRAVRRGVAVHVDGQSETSAEMAIRAGRSAMIRAGLGPSDVGALLLSEQCPDRPGYANEMEVAYGLRLDRETECATVNAQCASAVMQVEIAIGMMATGQRRPVLCIQTHALQRTFQDGDRWAFQFGDMATAVLVGLGGQNHVVDIEHVVAPEWARATVWRRRGDTDPAWYQGGPAWRVGALMDPHEMMRLVVDMQVEQVNELSKRHGATYYIGNQPRGWIPRMVAERCQLDTWDTWDDWAHIGACGAMVNLGEILFGNRSAEPRATQRPDPRPVVAGDKVIVTQLGAGLRCSSMVVIP